MRNFKTALLSALFASFAATAAQAGTKSFIILGKDLVPYFGASQGVLGLGIDLPDALSTYAIAVLTLPKDYKQNSPVELRARILAPENCAVMFTALAVLRLRPGDRGSESGGLSLPGPDLLVTGTSSAKMLGKTFKLNKSPDGVGTVAGQRPGDQIHAIFGRLGADPEDTCGDIATVTSVKVVYTTD